MENRCTGRTTRLIDKAIQTLFNKGKCYVIDHYYGNRGRNKLHDNNVLSRAYNRLLIEHSHIKDRLIIDEYNQTIEIKDFNNEE